ncbi:MAG: hypothetical protein R3F46_03415 [bacterium]
MIRLILILILPTILLLCSSCSSSVPMQDYQVPYVAELDVYRYSNLLPGQTAVLRYRIAYETISLPSGSESGNTAVPLHVTGSAGEIVPMLQGFAAWSGNIPDYDETANAWLEHGDSAASIAGHPAYREPYLYMLYRAPRNEQDVNVTLHLGSNGGPGNRTYSHEFRVHWPRD